MKKNRSPRKTRRHSRLRRSSLGTGFQRSIRQPELLEVRQMLAGDVDLAVSINDGVTAVVPGQQVTYTVTVTNAGPNAAQNARIVDNLTGILENPTWTREIMAPGSNYPASMDLSTLNGVNGFAIQGVDNLEFFRGGLGASVSAAGDVNGDGVDDVIVGDSILGHNSYIVFGSRSLRPRSLDLDELDGSNGFAVNGSVYSGQVSGAGDVNGDGIDDVIIGDPLADPANKVNAGKSYVLFGKTSAFSPTFEVSSLNGSNGFVINGIDANDQSGGSVGGAGDVNGDGIDDLIIGAVDGDPGGKAAAGESYVVFGKTSFPASLNLSALNGTNGFRIDGASANDVSGTSVSGAGDVNGDGIDDVIIGARLADPNGNGKAGESYVVFGKSSGFSPSFSLGALNGSNGFRIRGVDANDESGVSVSGAGDVNGDGFDDLVVGARAADANGNFKAGASYVVFGKAGGFAANFDLSSLTGANGFAIKGVDEYDAVGSSVSGAGDVNGDGFDDLIVGAYHADPNESSKAGESYLVFGKAGGFAANLNLSSLNGANGFELTGIQTHDYSGRSVSDAGDINGDGLADVLIGAPGVDFYNGETYVVFGGARTSVTTSGSGDINQTVNVPVDGAVIYTITGTVPGLASGSLTNRATVTAGAGDNDTKTSNNTATDVNTSTASLIQFSEAAYQIEESSSPPILNVTLTRTGGLGIDSRFEVRLINGSAQGGPGGGEGVDFNSDPIFLNFDDAETERTIGIPVTRDPTVEGNENFTLQVHPFFNAAVGAQSSALVTIIDDDTASFTVEETNGETSMFEGGFDGILVKLDAQPRSNVVLNVSSSNPSAATVAPTSLTFTRENWFERQVVNVTGVDGPNEITVRVSVNDGASDNLWDPLADQTVAVTVNNLLPNVAVDNAEVTVDEGQTATNTGTFSDFGNDVVTVTASIGAISQNNGNGTWSWSLPTGDGPEDGQRVSITATDSDGALRIVGFNLVVNNVAPTSTIEFPTVTVDEGQRAENAGTFRDPGTDAVLMSASVGNLVKVNGENPWSGTWTWLLDTLDGPDESQTVSISTADPAGAESTNTFQLVVRNLPPTVSAANATVVAEQGSVAVNTGVFGDPGADDVTVTSSIGAVTQDNLTGAWSWSYDTASSGLGSQTVTIRAIDSDGAQTTTTFALLLDNAAPTVAADNASVTVGEGQTAVNTGTFSDVGGGGVTLTASVGAITKNNANRTWSWSLPTSDGPEDSQTVTITAEDADGGLSSTNFELVVENLPPTTVIQNAIVTVNEGQVAANSGTFEDPGQDAVIMSVSTGSWVKVNGPNVRAGTWTWTLATTDGPAESQTVTVTTADGRGDAATNSFQLIVNNVAPTVTVNQASVTVGQGQTAANSGTFGDAGADAVTITASLGAVTQNNATGAWNWSWNTNNQPTGPRNVTITATDSDGAPSTVRFTVQIGTSSGLPGDFDANGVVNAVDIDLLSAAIRDGSTDSKFDVNQSGSVNGQDADYLVSQILGTRKGDANLDGTVQFDDFLRLAAGFGRPGGWSVGVFDATLNVDFPDFLALAANFGKSGPAAAAAARSAAADGELDADAVDEAHVRGAVPIAGEDITADLVGYWRFEDVVGNVVPDSSTLGEVADDGTLKGQASIDFNIGVGGGALALAGTADYVGIAGSNDISTRITPQRTIGMWFYAIETSSRQVLYEEGGGSRGLNIYIDSGKLYVGGWNRPSNESNWSGTWLSTPVNSGAWHHVTLVLNGTNTVKANSLIGYLDGVEFARGAGSQVWGHGDPSGVGAVNASARFQTGISNQDGANGLHGFLDELRIYNRALTAAEVTLLNDTAPVSVPTVRLEVGMELFNVVFNSAPGTVFIVASGVHEVQRIRPKDGMTFIGEEGAILDGMNEETVAFFGSAENVTLRNLEIRNYASPDFRAAIDLEDLTQQEDNARNWVLDDLFIHDNASHGISMGDNTTVTNSRINNNGLVGIGGRQFFGGLIENNVISGNNTRVAYPGSHGGGIKTTKSFGLVIRNNTVQNNEMAGIWCDIGCVDWTVENNTVSNSQGRPGSGIHFEISSGAIIRNNTISNVGRPEAVWAWGAGIQISASRNVEVIGNTISGADSGIGIVQQDRDPNIMVDNITIIGNTMRDSGRDINLQTGAVTDTGDSSLFNRNFTFESNVYRGGRQPRFWWRNNLLTFTQWKAEGFDKNGSYQP